MSAVPVGAALCLAVWGGGGGGRGGAAHLRYHPDQRDQSALQGASHVVERGIRRARS